MKGIFVIAAVVCVALTFRIAEEDTVGDINWPFTGCNGDSINITALALTAQPAKNKNITAKVVSPVKDVDR